jgi:hypothetical protein
MNEDRRELFFAHSISLIYKINIKNLKYTERVIDKLFNTILFARHESKKYSHETLRRRAIIAIRFH